MKPLWISEAEVAALLDLPLSITVLERALQGEAAGEATNMVKTHAAWEHGGLHALGAVFPVQGIAGTKTWAHTAAGAAPLLILFDTHAGSALAVIEALTLGQLRTGGMSAVATDRMAAAGADQLAIIGTGKQAFTQVAAVQAVRPLRRVAVFSPTPEHRRSFVARVQGELGLQATAFDSVATAVADAPIITTVTRAREPFLHSAMLTAGTHINAVGAITSERAEIGADVLPRCAPIIVDSLPAAEKLARELTDYFADRNRSWQDVRPLCEIVAASESRPPTADLTLFKAMGTGIADLALGLEVYRRKGRQ